MLVSRLSRALPAMLLCVGAFLWSGCPIDERDDVRASLGSSEFATGEDPTGSSPASGERGSTAISVDLGAETLTGAVIQGFYEREPAIYGRWMGQEAKVVLQVPGNSGSESRPFFVRVSGVNHRSDQYAVMLLIDGEIVAKLDRPQRGAAFSLWTEALNLIPGQDLKIGLRVSATYKPADHGFEDERVLGTVVDEVSILPAESKPAINFSRRSQNINIPVSGMFAPEPDMAGQWAGTDANVVLEKPPSRDGRYLVMVRGINYRPDQYTISVFLDNQHLGDIESPAQGSPFVLAASCSVTDPNPLVKIRVVTDKEYRPSNHGLEDDRALGVFLESIEIGEGAVAGCVDFTTTDVDVAAIEGVFPEEEGLEGLGRWIGPEAALRVSVPQEKRVFHSLVLEGVNYRIDESRLSTAVEGDSVFSFSPPNGKFSIRMPMKTVLEPGAVARVDLRVTPPFVSDELNGTQRVLGVVVRRVCIE